MPAKLSGQQGPRKRSATKPQCFHSFAADRRLCLPANTHLLFLGESTMRFQYLLLAWALLHQVEYRDRDQEATDARRLHNIGSFIENSTMTKARGSVQSCLAALTAGAIVVHLPV